MDNERSNNNLLLYEEKQQLIFAVNKVEERDQKQDQSSSLLCSPSSSESMEVEVLDIEKENGKTLSEEELKSLNLRHQITILTGEKDGRQAVLKSENMTKQSLLGSSSTSKSKVHRRSKRRCSRPMSSKKKKQLSHNIYKLSSKELGPLVHIIQLRENCSDRSPNEIDIDLEKLKPSTLRELKSYVASCLKKQPRKSRESAERYCYKGLKKLFTRSCRCSSD